MPGPLTVWGRERIRAAQARTAAQRSERTRQAILDALDGKRTAHWVSYKTGRSAATVQRTLSALITEGLITRDGPRNRPGVRYQRTGGTDGNP